MTAAAVAVAAPPRAEPGPRAAPDLPAASSSSSSAPASSAAAASSAGGGGAEGPAGAARMGHPAPPSTRRRPTQTYRLLGHSIVLSEGDCALSNTGWRTWAGAWLVAHYFDTHPQSRRRSILDLSCGTGLAGIALSLAGHRAVLCDMEVCLPTVRANVARNARAASGAAAEGDAAGWAAEAAPPQVVGYSWGTPLPSELREDFDIILCGDLLYHVWSGRLLTEFLTTLQYLHGRRGGGRPELIFGFQVRSGRQESQVLEAVARRLGLEQEEVPLDIPAEQPGDAPLLAQAKYRLVRMHGPEDRPPPSTAATAEGAAADAR